MSTAGKRPKRAKRLYSKAHEAGERVNQNLGHAGRGIHATIGGAVERINDIMGGKPPPKKRKKK